MQTQTARLLSEWPTKRGALIGALVGLDDGDLDRRPQGAEWSIRGVAEHTLYWERDSLTAGLRDLAGSQPWRADPALEYGGPVPRAKLGEARR